jgi:hypothetical protein
MSSDIPVGASFGIPGPYWDRTPISPLELIFSGVISVCTLHRTMLLQSSYDIEWELVSDPFGVPYLDQNLIWPLDLIFSGIISVCHSSS